MTDPWKKLCSLSSQRWNKCLKINSDFLSLLTDEIVENRRELNLGMDVKYVVQLLLLNYSDPKLIIDELIELNKLITVEETEDI